MLNESIAPNVLSPNVALDLAVTDCIADVVAPLTPPDITSAELVVNEPVCLLMCMIVAVPSV